MVNTKNQSVPVVDKKQDKSCSCDCGCEGKCSCGCGECGKTLLKCGTILLSALIISGSIVFSSSCLCLKKGMGPAPVPGKPAVERRVSARGGVVSDKAMHDYIMKNPKVLIESVDQYYRAQEEQKAAEPQKEFKLEDLEAAPADIVKKITADKANYSLGNPKGTFVIIEFFDHQCGWCKRTNQAMYEALASKEGKNIRWIPIDTPIFGEQSEMIARYVLAAGKQGKYAEMHKAVGEAKKVDEASLIEIGKTLKLNTKKLTADANSAEIKGKLEANKEYSQALKIGGVPMLIVDGRINPGALFGDRLEVVKKAAAAKKK